MSFRTAAVFQVQSASIPQPLFGSWITAVSPAGALSAPNYQAVTLTLGTQTSSGNDATNIFKPNEQAWLIDPSGGNAEAVILGAVSGNTVVLNPQGNVQNNPVTRYSHVAGAFGTGTFIIPKQLVNSFLVNLEDGATGPWLYLGNQYNMTATFRRFYKLGVVLSGVQPYFFSAGMFTMGNPIDISEIFVLGSYATDLYNVSLVVD